MKTHFPHLSLDFLLQRTAFGVAGELVRTRGWGALWHGLSAGIGKAVPKYVTAVAVKQWMEGWLTPVEDPAHNRTAWIIRSAKKAVTAGVLGAVLTNPFDVLRNHMCDVRGRGRERGTMRALTRFSTPPGLERTWVWWRR